VIPNPSCVAYNYSRSHLGVPLRLPTVSKDT